MTRSLCVCTAKRQQDVNHLLIEFTTIFIYSDLEANLSTPSALRLTLYVYRCGANAHHLMEELNDHRLLEQHYWFFLTHASVKKLLMLFDRIIHKAYTAKMTQTIAGNSEMKSTGNKKEQGTTSSLLDGHHINIRNDHGIDILGDIIESSVVSPTPSIMVHCTTQLYIMLGRQGDPHGKFNMPPGVMEHFETATQDPSSSRLHKYIDNIFKEHKDYLSHTKSDIGHCGELQTDQVAASGSELDLHEYERSVSPCQIASRLREKSTHGLRPVCGCDQR
ncbi:Hemocyanin C chain-like 5 [Homarus americanus]|uniref:Hemocyanin C chain-like 5 n=1 Tax=Homarus americanus TaxID=6706 RepID=A0A8J5JF99_HOMAM|nr:Hemocyanin C chain-like 5 [Homarus americanus]